jgi:exodeoxyribonuclease-3
MPSIAAEAQRHGRHLLVAGDLNVLEPGHIPHHHVFGKWEYDFYTSFLHAGRLRDAFREHNGTEIDHSWFGHRSGLGYRFDHLFCSAGVEILACHYDHKTRQTGLSDHSALTARLRLPPHTPRVDQSAALNPVKV